LIGLVGLGLVAGVRARAETVPTVAFTCDFPASDPAHYGISVSSDGHASYVSDGKLTRDSQPDDQPYSSDFTLSSATTSHIFDLAQKANYFAGELDSKKKGIAVTGEKTLSYKDSQRSSSATYNYSLAPPVQELTALFQSLSVTLEFGRRLEYEYHYQKLALDDELKSLEDLANRNDAREVKIIAPTLQKILNDPSVMNTIRARAQRLLALDAAGNK